MRTKSTPIKRPPRTKQTPKKKSVPKNNLSKGTYNTPIKAIKQKHPSTPSTASTRTSTLSSSSRKSGATAKTIESAYRKVNIGKLKTPEDEDVNGFDVYEIDFTKKPSVAHALNFLMKEDDLKELVGATHRELVTAVLETQTLSVCKQLYQIVAVKFGHMELTEAVRDAAGFGNKSKPDIVNALMRHVNYYKKLKPHERVKGSMVVKNKSGFDNDSNTSDVKMDIDMSIMKEETSAEESDDMEYNEDNEEEVDVEVEEEEDDEEVDEDEEENEDEGEEEEEEEEDEEEEEEEEDYDNVRKTNLKKTKGKKQYNNKDDDDSKYGDGSAGSVDPFGKDVFSSANIKSKVTRGDSGGTFLHISKPIKVIGKQKHIHVGVIELGLSTFWVKGDFMALPLVSMQGERNHPFTNHIDPKMSWVQTIKNCDRRIQYSTEDLTMKTSKGSTQSVIVFVIETSDMKSAPSIQKMVASIVLDLKKCFKVYKKPGSVSRGSAFLDFLLGIGNQGLHGFFLRKYSDGVHPEPAADALTAIFDATFNDPGLKLSWNISMDRFLTNFDIKQILVNHANVTCWDDLPDADKEACFQNSSTDISRLPNWNTMVKHVDYI